MERSAGLFYTYNRIFTDIILGIPLTGYHVRLPIFVSAKVHHSYLHIHLVNSKQVKPFRSGMVLFFVTSEKLYQLKNPNSFKIGSGKF